MKKLGTVLLFLMAIGLITGGWLGALGTTANAQPQAKCYSASGGENWVAADGCEWEMRSGSELDIQEGATVSIAGLTEQTPQEETVAAGFSLTPTGSYIILTSASGVTSSTSIGIITSTLSAGTRVLLQNGNAADTITIDGTGGTVECKANVVLGTKDTLELIFDGTEWNCVSTYDNS